MYLALQFNYCSSSTVCATTPWKIRLEFELFFISSLPRYIMYTLIFGRCIISDDKNHEILILFFSNRKRVACIVYTHIYIYQGVSVEATVSDYNNIMYRITYIIPRCTRVDFEISTIYMVGYSGIYVFISPISRKKRRIKFKKFRSRYSLL